MKNFLTYLKRIGKLVLLDIGIVLTFIIVGGLFLLFTNTASAESFSTLSGLPGLPTSQVPSIGEFINVIFRMAIGLGSVIAVLMIVIGGFEYLSTDVFQRKSAGREKIENALLGLGLLLGSSLLLGTINPDLLRLDFKPDQTKIETGKKTLNVDNFDAVINEQNEIVKKLESEGYKAGGCSGYKQMGSLGNNKNDVEWVARNYQSCNADLEEAREKNLTTEYYTTCAVSMTQNSRYTDYTQSSTITTNILRVCYYEKKPN